MRAVNGKGGIHLCHEPTGRRSRKSGGIGKQSQVGFGAETRRGKATGMMRGRGGSRGGLGVQPISLGRGGSNKTPANNTMPLKAVPEGSKVLNRVGGGAHSAEQPARRLINTHMSLGTGIRRGSGKPQD